MRIEDRVEVAAEKPESMVDAGAVDIRRTGIHPNFWYPVARSRAVKPGKCHPVFFAGEPIALVRTRQGGLFAVEDRCAHRQIPLHLGTVEGDSIKCAYHGWKYDLSGACVNVPYQDKCNLRPNSVRSYPCREQHGLVFVYPGELDKLDSAELPQIPAIGDRGYKALYIDKEVKCHFTFMHENLMDMNHQFLHRRFMGGVKAALLDTRRGSNWLEADYTFSRGDKKQPLGERFIIGKPEKVAERARDLMTIRTEYPYQTLKFRTGGGEQPALVVWNVYVPLDREQRTNHTYSLLMIKRPSIPGVLQLLWPIIVWFTRGIFEEDRKICELEQLAFDSQSADWNHETFPVIQSLRRLLVENSIPLSQVPGARPMS